AGTVHAQQCADAPQLKPCIFEFVYLARPDSVMDGISVYQARLNLGEALARRVVSQVPPSQIDVVIPIPESSRPSAAQLAQLLGLPYREGFVKNRYVGRTFIEPQQSIRHFGVRLKLNPVREVLAGKRVVVVDDSIVRGTTSRKIVKMLRDAGASQVHLRISSPPTRWPCFYGIDTPNRRELIAASHSVDEISKYVTADSLQYLSIEGLRDAVGYPRDTGAGHCEACFSGDYPVPFVPVDRLRER
ncbi:MAG: amidophosphoribosyltransferase, partial [Deltaproteobacteria bacterium]